MTAVDWIILLVILLYTLNGFHRGFIGTIFNLFGSLAALIAALACASHFRVQVGAKIAPYLKESVSASMPTLSTSVSTSASELWNSISGYLQNILSSQHVSLEVLQAAEDPRDTMLSAIALCVGEALAYVMIFLVSFHPFCSFSFTGRHPCLTSSPACRSFTRAMHCSAAHSDWSAVWFCARLSCGQSSWLLRQHIPMPVCCLLL